MKPQLTGLTTSEDIAVAIYRLGAPKRLVNKRAKAHAEVKEFKAFRHGGKEWFRDAAEIRKGFAKWDTGKLLYVNLL